MKIPRKAVHLGLAGGLMAAGGRTWLAYRAAMAEARERTSPTLSSLVRTRSGDLEFAIAGRGDPVLMIHGAGGGFDQGLFFAEPLSRGGYKVIAPSRFGYLRSSMPADASSENQADAYADLLDALEIDAIPVIAGSAGALSAAAFAIRHPDRCSALALIAPIGYAPDGAPVAMSGAQQRLAGLALRSDFACWTALRTAPEALIGTLMATDPALVRAASADERERVKEILWRILPVSRRRRGLMNDARLAGNVAPVDLSAIRAPTLAISFEDDRYGTLPAARRIASAAPDGRLVAYPSGGHVWVGHQDEMFARIGAFLRDARKAA